MSNGRNSIEFVLWDIPSRSVHSEASYEPIRNDVQMGIMC